MNFLFPYMARWKAINWSRYHQIFTKLAENGHNVYVIQPPSCNLQETNFQEIEAKIPSNLHLLELPLNSIIWNFEFPLNKLVKKGYYSLMCRKIIKKMINKYDIDVLFLYNIPQFHLMKINSCFTIFDFADDYIEMLKHELGKFSNQFVLTCANRILTKILKKADLTLVVSNELANSIKNKNGHVEVLSNGADLPNLTIKKNNEMGYKKPVIGFIGAFEYFIDFGLILNIAEKLSDMTFLLVGSGREFKKVKEQKEQRKLNNVILTGAVPHIEIEKYINEMDVCLNVFKKIPISHSACPIKLFEYLIVKKPVISTRLKELERIDKNFIFFSDTVEEFVKTITMILENNELRSKFIERGYKVTVENYTWDIITKQLLILINNTNKEN